MEKISGARMTIEQQVMTLEGANVSLEAMNAMRMGAQSMKSIHRDMYVHPSLFNSPEQEHRLC